MTIYLGMDKLSVLVNEFNIKSESARFKLC